ncbi:MAG: hypothetical protein DRJ31_08605 [Candidatus Methanomethylicota archaeon]|uniref:Stage II sporulation protein M n=1 Tax=Thermoproteota archaeon TaxID=2056631 RepID=A0A497EL84_9CREN|nr:MAG: hypothetical protein DRJ31_08605 [Candidatus Verstraetearchaeota archaeon]
MIVRVLGRRLKLAIPVSIILIMLMLAGSLIPLGAEEGEKIGEELEKLDERGLEQGIFLNNFAIALTALAPFLGPIIMGYVAFHTGRFLGWIGLELGMPPQELIPLALERIILTGYGLLEFLGYGMAVSESLTLSYYILRARKLLRNEIRILPAIIGIIALLLLLGALIEAALIKALQNMAMQAPPTIYRG